MCSEKPVSGLLEIPASIVFMHMYVEASSGLLGTKPIRHLRHVIPCKIDKQTCELEINTKCNTLLLPQLCLLYFSNLLFRQPQFQIAPSVVDCAVPCFDSENLKFAVLREAENVHWQARLQPMIGRYSDWLFDDGDA